MLAFVLALPFHHGDLELDGVGVSTREGVMREIKTPPSATICTKNAGGEGRICRTLRYLKENNLLA